MDKINTSNKKLAGKIKEHFAPAKQTGLSSSGKIISKANKEYLSTLEMWPYYLNFSRLEF